MGDFAERAAGLEWGREPTDPGLRPLWFFGMSRKIEAYNAILAEEVKRAGGRYFDLWPLMSSQADAGKVALDGLHPNALAHAEWAQAIATELAKKPQGNN